MSKVFGIEISSDILEDKLADILKKGGEQHYKLISKKIIGNLGVTSVGLKQLYLAFSGFEEKVDFLPGDEVFVDESKVYNWGYDKEAMREAGLVVNGQLKVQIVHIYEYTSDNISIKYMRITGPGQAPSEYTQAIESRHLRRTSECKITRPEMGDLI